MEQVKNVEQVNALLKPYGLTHEHDSGITDLKMPEPVSSLVPGLDLLGIVVCDETEFLEKNPLIRSYLATGRHDKIEDFLEKQEQKHKAISLDSGLSG